MTKNSWISAWYCDPSSSKENCSQEITYSSDSDDELIRGRKRLKLIQLSNLPLTMKYTNSEETISIPKCGNIRPQIESPMIGLSGQSASRLSPDIYSNPYLAKQLSPIIEKRKKRLKKRNDERGNNVESYRAEDSPDLFGTQSIDSESPNNMTYTQEVAKIEPFPSQFGSKVDRVCVVPVPLYYEPHKRHRKFKKDSLAFQLSNALKQQRAATSIWFHEKITKKETNCASEENSLIFVVSKFWKEYGTTVLKCKPNTDHLTSDKFLIIVGTNMSLNINWEISALYELYSPYKMKTIVYNNQKVICYYDVKKYLKKIM